LDAAETIFLRHKKNLREKS